MSNVYYDFIDAVEVDKDLCTLIAMEECSKLIQAISKAKRGKLDKDNLAEKMADVCICLEWIEKAFGIDEEEVAKWYDKKVDRIINRLNSGEFK